MGEQPQKRTVPQSDLDLQMLTTNSVWGQSEVPAGLKAKLDKYFLSKDKDGNDEITREDMWSLLGFYTRDMRLANLSVKDGELTYVQYFIDLANHFLQINDIDNFLVAIGYAATRLELSQSKGGFLRKRLGTFTQESTHQEIEPPKKNLFGKSGQGRGN